MPPEAPDNRPGDKAHPTDSNALTLTGLERGTEFGSRYRILELLGQGGMGVVYLAHDNELNRDVALKLIKPSLNEKPNALERFKREILLASKITHKNVLRIHDLGDIGGIKYVSMAYVEGEDLARLIHRQGALPPERACSILKQILLGLKAAHDEGVLHRDLKPQNIILDRQDNVYITDFGLARTLETSGEEESLTATGEVVGTPMYLSPEQIRGERTDERTDLYSVGLISYQMLTGQTPFEAVSGFRWILQRMDSRPKDPGDSHANIPRFLRDFTRKCTESNPDFRYQTAAEALQELDTQHVQWMPSLSIRSLIFRRAALAAIVVLLIAAAFWFFRPETVETKSIAIAVLPFGNVEDWKATALMDLTIQELHKSRNIQAVSGKRVFQIIKATGTVNTSEIQQITNATSLLSGQYSESNNKLRVQGLLKYQGQESVIDVEEKDIVRAVRKLSEQLEEKLGISKPDQEPAILPFLSHEQLQVYYRARLLEFQGKNTEAVSLLQSVLKKDGSFAPGAANLARIYFEQGNDKEASKYAGIALQSRNNLTMFEQHQLTAIQARIAGNKQKTEETYALLSQLSPNDPELYYEIGSYFYEQEDWNRALENYRKAYEFDPKSVYVLTALGRTELRNANPQTALKYLTEAQTLSKFFENDKERGSLMNMLGWAYWLLGYQESALEHYQKAMAIRLRIGDQSGLADTLGNTAIVYKSLGKYEESLRQYQQALEIARASGDEARAGRFLNNLGTLTEKVGHFEEALKYYNDGLAVARSVGSRSEITNRLSNIGWIHYLQGRYTDAITYFDLALQEVGESDRMLKAPVLVYQGNVWADQGKYSKALDAFSSAIQMWRKAQYPTGLAFALTDAAHVLNLIGDSENAQKYLQEAERLANDLKDSELSALLWIRQSELMRMMNRFDLAQLITEETLRIAQQGRNPSLVLMAKLEIAAANNQLKKPHLSIPVLELTLSEAEDLHLSPLSVRARLEMARAHFLSGQTTRSLRELPSCIDQARELGLSEVLFQAHALTAVIRHKEGRQTDALQHLDQALQVAEKIKSESGNYSGTFLKRNDIKELVRFAAEIYRAAGKDASPSLRKLTAQ